ncbi:hypothetical protein FSARC_3451 [Fusarium sarcochroum]|uniref:Uncharacterized protein n=1 Tax=Fusarium sarcochroum TaxID=1208366 RepID=A0A8H4U3V1_9HYPO|nr:hypothetical protein FSARC_3451 [Fusarium sarcochroum]
MSDPYGVFPNAEELPIARQRAWDKANEMYGDQRLIEHVCGPFEVMVPDHVDFDRLVSAHLPHLHDNWIDDWFKVSGAVSASGHRTLIVDCTDRVDVGELKYWKYLKKIWYRMRYHPSIARRIALVYARLAAGLVQFIQVRSIINSRRISDGSALGCDG